jgi:hypothetical protein
VHRYRGRRAQCLCVFSQPSVVVGEKDDLCIPGKFGQHTQHRFGPVVIEMRQDIVDDKLSCPSPVVEMQAL